VMLNPGRWPSKRKERPGLLIGNVKIDLATMERHQEEKAHRPSPVKEKNRIQARAKAIPNDRRGRKTLV